MSSGRVGNNGFFHMYGLYFAWVVAMAATAGSLYFSEIAGYAPCELCWFQRIFMYPLVLLLGIASYRNDKKIKYYVMPLSVIGGLISIYHYLLQKVPGMVEVLPCSSGVPCSGQYINVFDFVTIPLLALIAFSLITLLLALLSGDK